MAINANQIVKVVPRTINAGASELEIVGLFLTTNSLCPFPAALSFSSASGVKSYFGADSKEYAQASKYFVGYDNSFTKPKRLWFARYVSTAIPGCCVGTGTVSKLAVLKTVTAGQCVITVDGTDVTVTGIDLSTITTESDAAVKLQTALGGVATVEYNSNMAQYVITSNTSSDTSSVVIKSDGDSTGSNKLLYYMGLCDESGKTTCTTWTGSAALEPAENMAAIIDVTQNWVSFTTLDEVDKDTVVKFAEWVSAQECEYLYCPYSTEADTKNPLAAGNLPSLLKKGDYEGVILTYGTVDYATLVMSMGACIDWERLNGVITYAFKSQSGLEATIDNDTDASNCEDLKVNFYGNYATRNDDFLFYYNGAMSGGKFNFVDAYVSQLWLRNVLQVALVNVLTQVGRIPYNEEGYTIIKAAFLSPLQRALDNGSINPGVSLSEAQKSQVVVETGDNSAPDTIFLTGYYLRIDDPSTSVRAVRGTPTIYLYYTYGGAVQKLIVPTTMIQ